MNVSTPPMYPINNISLQLYVYIPDFMPDIGEKFVRTEFGGTGHLTQTSQDYQVKSTESKFQESLQVKTYMITISLIHY